MVDAIRTDGLTKFYGKVRGIEGLDLTVRVGEVFGYLGPNGAGKTTTIRLLLDLIRPTAGRAEVLGLDTRTASLQVRRRLGYLPGELHLYENMSGRELVRYLGALRGRDDRGHAAELAERLDLDLDRPIKSLSKGNKQKVGLVQALAHRPELLVLDEPTSGLDPLVQHEFHRMLDEARQEGRTVLLSSHDLAEVEHIADRVGIIRSGRLVAVDAIADLKAKAVHRLELHFGAPVPADAFAGLPGVRDLQVEGTTLRCGVAGSVDALVKAAARFEVTALASREADLEELFLTYYQEEDGDRAA